MASGKTKKKSGAGNAYLRAIDPLNVMGLGRSKAKSSSGSFNPYQTPTPQGSANFYGDQLVSQTYQDPTYGTVTRYNPSQAELEARTAAQNRISQILPTLGQTAPEMAKQYDDMANAYADQQTAAFNREYEPAQRNMREDYASRFGGGQNTPYIDAMGDMEKRVRIPALLDIANNATQMKQNLYNTQEAQKLNELQALGYQLNGTQANFLQNLQNPQQVSNQGNAFNQGNYQNLLQNYQFQQQLKSQGNQALMNAIAAIGGAAAKSAF